MYYFFLISKRLLSLNISNGETHLKIDKMKNLTSTIETGLGFGTTKRVTKSFETLINGAIAKLSVYRNEDTDYSFKSNNYYTLEYKGQQLGSHNMGKSQLKWNLDFIKSGKFDSVFTK